MFEFLSRFRAWRARPSRPAVRAFRPRLEALEERSLLSGTSPGPAVQPRREAFVQSLYQAELGRTGSQDELDGWARMMDGSLAAQTAVASGIARSPEARDRLVKAWYVTYLGRPAQGGEEMGFLSSLLAGASQEQVLGVLLGSPEFTSHAQGLSTSDSPQNRVVQTLDQFLLSRAPSSTELAAQLDGLASMGQQELALLLLQGPEYRSNVISRYYSDLLHRPADTAGLAGWVSSGPDLTSVRVGFYTSPEFYSDRLLAGQGSGTYAIDVTAPADVGVGSDLQGTAVLAALGQVTVTGSVHSVGFIVVGQATGQLTFSNASGSVTIALTGPPQPGFSALPQQFSYQVVSGTGAYAQLSDQGSLTLLLLPRQTATGPDLQGTFTLTI
jgi:hypothetical protein